MKFNFTNFGRKLFADPRQTTLQTSIATLPFTVASGNPVNGATIERANRRLVRVKLGIQKCERMLAEAPPKDQLNKVLAARAHFRSEEETLLQGIRAWESVNG